MYSQAVTAAEEYRKRLNDREHRFAHYGAVALRLGYFRLAIAVIAASLAWESFKRHNLSPWWIILPALAFICLADYHSRILRKRDLAQRGATFYKAGLARLEHRWAGTGATGERFNDPHHVYAADLDLFGRGGLFELLSTARTRMGEETLARWLLSPSSADQIAERHIAILELRDQLDLREDLAVLGDDASVGVYPEAFFGWCEGVTRIKPQWLQWLAPVLAIAALAGAVIWGALGSATPFLITILLEGFFTYRLRHQLEQLLHDSEKTFDRLDLLSSMLARLEQHRFHAPHLQSLQRDISSGQIAGSRALARLRTIADLVNSRDNLFVRVLNIPLMYAVQVGFAAGRWRQVHGRSVRIWLSVIGQIEALLCLANYSYEHPDDPFPEFLTGAARLDADEIGHPLIAEASCVRNSIHLSDTNRVFLVSGSNMSGKSTLLRTVGINVVLAMAGAPVRARRLRLTPLHVGASIRVNDSLQEGSSRFYAEITRLRKIYDLAANYPPVLFLLDELLQGTNSHDRRIGAEGVVCALLNRGAIGLVSTHDLALAEIGASLGGHLRNVHFQEEFADGKMQFDYKLHEGVVTKSNGLALMRSIGLDV
jgi:hypothetical protein